MAIHRTAIVSWLALLLFQASAWAEPVQPKATPTRPNIVILYADDMGYGDLAIQNKQSKIPTPHLDQLARQGMRFTDAHSSSGICTPSRYALLTGRYHWRKFHGIVQAFGPSVFAAQRLTMPEMLKAQGYTTACIGKWHLGWDWDAIKRPTADDKARGGLDASDFDWTKPIPNGPLAHGFDYYFGDDVPNFPPYTWIENDRVVEVPTVPYVPQPTPSEGSPEGRPGPMVVGWQQDQVMPRLTEKVVQWLGEQKGGQQPFFLYFPWTSPHAPIVPTKEFQGSTKAGGYGDFMHQSDWCAGQVLAALEANGMAENTLVIFTSDNGPERYAYDRVKNFEHRSMGPLRGLKRDIWEGGHRVPMVIRWPGVVKAGTVSEALVSQIDLIATLAGVVGFELPETAAEDSFNQLPLLRGEPESSGIRTSLVHNTNAGKYAIRQNDWLLVDANSGGVSAVPKWFDDANGYARNPFEAELYNLRTDVGQHENLLARYPAKAAEMRALLATIQTAGHSSPRHATHNELQAGTGIMVGEVTAESVLAQIRLSKAKTLVNGKLPGAAGVVEFTLTPHDQPQLQKVAMKPVKPGTRFPEGKYEEAVEGKEAQPQVIVVEALAERDFIVRAAFAKLEPATEYRITTKLGADRENMQAGPMATFTTLPGEHREDSVRLVVVTGMNYAKFHGDNRIDRAQHLIENNTELPENYTGPDKHMGYPALATILQFKPNAFIGTGDNVYYDTPDNPRAQTLPELRHKWHEQFVQPRYTDLFAAVPTYWEIDDHDYRVDDSDNTGDYAPSPAEGRALMLEQLPVAPADQPEAKTYRTHRINADLQVWFTEGRMYRSPNSMPDGPEKTLWGAEQKAWLKKTLAASTAKYKLLISPTPMIGPDDLRKTDNHCDIGGFRHERNEFFAFLKESGLDQEGFYIVCGDRHWQYHSIDPSGIEEFSCGALVDANSRLGRKPGDPKSTDPEGTIRQPYYQTPRSGGFLMLETAAASAGNPATLTITWYDEHGKLLHRTQK